MMRRRPFQYGVLLRVRQRREDLKAQASAAARRQVEIAEEQRRQLHEEQHRAMQHAGELAHNHFDASEVRRYYQYERHLAMLVDRKDAEIIELKRIESEKQRELEEATRDRRVMEQLRDRHNASYRQYLEYEENKALDEAGVNLAVRNRPMQGQIAGNAQESYQP